MGVVLDLEEDKENVNKIETWPLVQSFALDGVGKGFYSMELDSLKDISNDINSLYKSFDVRNYHQLFNNDIGTFKTIFSQACDEMYNSSTASKDDIFNSKFEIDICTLNYKSNI